MTNPSPICLVDSAATTDGVNVTAGASFTIALSSTAGVNVWSIECLSTDETNDKDTINASLSVNNTNKTATCTAPATTGSAMRFRSIVNNGRGTNGQEDSSLTTTFGVYVLSDTGQRVLAFDETLETNSEFGWIATVNPPLRTTVGQTRLIAGGSSALYDWSFDETASLSGNKYTASTFASTGSAGGSLTAEGNGVAAGIPGVYGDCVYLDGNTMMRDTSSMTHYPPTNSITLEAWARPVNSNGYQDLIAKKYVNDGSWSQPYASVTLGIINGIIRVECAFGADGTATSYSEFRTQQNAYLPIVGHWNHIGMTFDGSTIIVYHNGSPAPVSLTTGPSLGSAIDWHTSNPGPWSVGGVKGTSTLFNTFTGHIDQARVWSVVKDADYFKQTYKRGMNLGTSTLL